MKKRGISLVCLVILFSVLTVEAYCPPHFLDREIRTVEAGVDLEPQKVAVIVHRYYDLELTQGIMNVPVIAIYTPGPFVCAMERAKDVQERIETTFDLLENVGGYLFVDNDECNPAVYWHDETFVHWFRIITIYEEDARAFGRADGNQHLLATYIKAQIEAHYTLFWEIATSIVDYEVLDLDETREGLIYKEIFLRMKEYATEMHPHTPFPNLSKELRKLSLKDSLARIGLLQRKRLTLLAHIIPRDWLTGRHTPKDCRHHKPKDCK